ncbi:alpha-2,8-polysialyltransferase family protein [Streptomyces sp. NBC_00249]|uniref:polysialyltransferase family glycosyltransferase n=1 Tax=Streptomyces sp. NBC_00249 TaxID=2975690 RepID=UPI002253E9BB|nr:polysialyltransferase family glycosyltransferase [Streptomyces sp. NBC_00249]MCX5194837.1 alpha-2,8-polysialyltransferase family protein [Streptomyces sp. NBC_00249]
MSTGRVTQVFLASTLYGTATLAAALDAGAFPPAGRRILLTSNHSLTPEITPGIEAMPGFAALRTRFDEVLDWNAVTAPQHPSTWAPRPDDVPMWERQLRVLWGLGEDRVELVVESLQVPPAQSLCQLFPGAAIDVYADGLMSYGPTRFRLDPQIGMRVRRVLHLDLVPGLEPLLLTEFGVRAELVPAPDFLKVLAELAGLPDQPAYAPGEPGTAPALLLGQYLSALDLMSAVQEEELHVAMVRGAVGRGHRELVFKPHPSAPAAYCLRAEAEAERLGARLTVLREPVLAETLYQRLRPALVVGCFSTGLLTARALYGIPVARTGTADILARLAPYQNSNRIPLTLVDALVPELAREEAAHEDPADLPGLVTAVGFSMQPRILAERRAEAEGYLVRHLTERTWRYFKRRRLTTLGLPGGIPAQLSFLPRSPAVRRVVHRLRRGLRRVS